MSILSKGEVDIVPFSYYQKDNTERIMQCFDIEQFDGKAYYDGIREGKMYNTSQVSPQVYFDSIAPYAEAGHDILHISMSSGISGSYNSSLIAKSMLEEAYPDRKFYMLDTRAASLGEGIVVLKAIEFKKLGMTIDKCYEALNKVCDCVYQIFTVDNLRHLQRTGRLSNAAAIIGTVLNIKPILKGNQKGEIVNIEKARGRKHAIKALAEKYNSIVKEPEAQVVGIAHADNEPEVSYLIDLLNEKNPPKEILSVCYEPVTGAHVGPGTVALFFLGDEDARSK